ncbi:UNVERIFIED_CONTAM: hypothetical protein PYX00_007930 [Menopon gallinae]|uniref:LisH domain-containing protein n=1 Tax=Menopon gallinae TaxID=328185 RepID=A0AAW2HMC4_9NEOP
MNSVRSENALSCAGDSGNWYNDFADKLISGNFLLTALEFHAELIESGRELPRLKEFFSNPGNFENLASNRPEVTYSGGLPRSSSQATLDSLDLTRYSEDGERSNDDRVAVLEFELRKAKETIVALRTNLTVATETESKQKVQEKSKDTELNKSQKSTIKPHEQRALNFLINEYLLLHGYKLTSITFSDENESQDFDDWDDVGLNVGRPVELLSLYREGLKASGYSNTVLTNDIGCQTCVDEEKENLLSRITDLETEVEKLTNKISSMNEEFSKRLLAIDTQETIELESHISLSPDPEYFEIIDNVKSREGSETKSDKSNGDWTKIGDKLKRGSIEIKSDSLTNYESVSISDKNQSNLFENLTDVSENEGRGRKSEDTEIKTETSNLEDVTIDDSFQYAMTDPADAVIDADDQRETRCIEKNVLTKERASSLFNIFVNSRELSDKFKNEFLVDCDMNIPVYNSDQILTEWFYQTDLNYLSVNQIVDILSETVPKIVPNIILNKREEIMPLLILSVCLNPNSSVRDKLLNLLFNLKKKPQEDERRMILSALSIIAQIMGSGAVENEVLPQCWEQITHKYVERRMLVAESCFILAPHVSEAIRNSLVMSIAKQLLQDREENVRRGAVNILALLIVLTSDKEKFSQILDLSLQILNDESTAVTNAAKCVLYPALAQWSFSLKMVQSELFPKLLNKLKNERSLCVISVIETLLPFLIMTVADSECILKDLSRTVPPAGKRQEFCMLCKGLCDPLVFYKGSVGKVMGAFDYYTSNPDFETSDWPEVEWIWKIFIPALLESADAAGDDSFLLGIISCFRHLCLGLGKNITRYKIKPYLYEKIQQCENSIVAGEEYQYSVIPLYLVGVLSINTDDQKEMDVTLRKFVCVLPLCGVSLTPLHISVAYLSRYQQWQVLVLDGIWEGVAHQRPFVRSATAKLFQSVVSDIPEHLVSSKVLPALITLCSDPEVSVRTSSIPTLGMLTKCKDKAIKDKVYMTLQSVLQDNSNLNNTGLVIQLVKTMGKIYDNCDQHFREEVIVSQLYLIASQNQNKSNELIEVLTEVFATVSFSQNRLSHHCISTALLPGLRSLENICGQLNLSFRDQIDSMIKEVERRIATSKEPISKISSLPSPSESKRIIPNPVSTQVVVEDVKNRVTKIFNTKPNTLQNVSGIFKKKS